ncbi:NAD-dependent epimerase/dehydratase family protein [Caballeronia sp. LZ032]|uniref:NAD-dependent epimerase/dehydratase family protein n=1 Tax=Caballeronia sp. LZ032 TaxID=3038565 RepID=UPI0028581FAF|nr:NAD-dependent epimerase/dehydratase family protein [Caballeronia sp. LZ032]MDR5878896.1 NAD-dependent epimerase/dehydratase family protein [Caballeronia sp. LZ032]
MSAPGQRIAVTGANGFVGRAVSRALLARGIAATGLVRAGAACGPDVEVRVVEGLDALGPEAFAGCEAVIHLAARVHVMGEAASQAEAVLEAYRAVNVAGALGAAEAARRAGATRFVLMSSIKALGEHDPGRPFSEDDERRPPDAYGASKAEAEVRLLEFGSRTGMEVVVVRPPLVYGPGVRANFLAMMNAVARGVPLPLGAIDARRSLVSVDNLASATVECALHPAAAGRVFHVTDGEDPGVAELVRKLGEHLGRPARLVPVPPGWLRGMARLAGKTAQIERLTNSLRVDSSRIRETLGWRAPQTLDQGLAVTAEWYRSKQR